MTTTEDYLVRARQFEAKAADTDGELRKILLEVAARWRKRAEEIAAQRGAASHP